MTLRRVIALASALMLTGLSAALAQFPPPPNPAGNAFPAPPSPQQQPSAFPAPGAAPARPASPFPMPGQQTPQPGGNPCEAFLQLRAAAEKDGLAIKAATERKATREEVCPLFKKFTAAEAKMVKFLKDNQQRCGVPPEAVKQSNANHAKTVQIRNQVCSAGPGPAAPRLSDAFSGPLVPNSDPNKPNRGTFNTMTGSPLGQ